LENRKDFEVLDMREVDKYKENHIKNAISCPVCHSDKSDAKAKLQASEVVPDFRKKLVLYTQSGDQPLQLPRRLARNKRVFMLKGGYNAWNDEIMKPQEYKPEDTQEEFIRKQKQNAISNYFQGKMDIQVPEKTVKKIPRKKHVISSGPDEGC
ncbi:MAG: rhodanese-like domain-containing protein, partial [Leptospiraceae bacterium]|nr:rhodanese-like domain-containing protein [Leptospiraceae bacterium]